MFSLVLPMTKPSPRHLRRANVITRIKPYKDPVKLGAESHLAEEIARSVASLSGEPEVTSVEASIKLIDRNTLGSLVLDLSRIGQLAAQALSEYGCAVDDDSIHVFEQCSGKELIALIDLENSDSS